jgi:hypothetical protein
MTARLRAFVIGAALGLAAPARGQSSPSQWTKPGDTLKVWAEVPPLRGARAVVLSAATDTVLFSAWSTTSRTWLETPVALNRITRLDVWDPARRSPGRTLFGAFTGSVIGAVVGGSIVYFTYQWACPTRDNDCDGGNGQQIDRKVLTTFGVAIVGIAGGITGGMMGARPGPGWRPVFFRH